MAIGKTRAGESPVPSGNARAVASGDLALAAILAPLRYGEGFATGLLGDSGTGKTHAAGSVIAGYLARVPGLAVIADSKREGRFEGQTFDDLGGMALSGLAPEPRVVVLQGNPFEGRDLDVESIARWQWKLAARRTPSLGVYDELTAATVSGQWSAGKRSAFPRTFGQGRVHRISLLWGTQSPQDVPREAFEQSTSIMCFKLAGLGLRLLGERDYLNGDVADVIQRLHDREDPPEERGDFVLLRRGRAWDGLIYRF
jgi:hypothetical protein